MNWQPIETAPKDRTEILAAVRYPKYGFYETFFVYWETEFEEYPEGVWTFEFGKPIKHGNPTHWMPVPQYVEPETKP